MKSFKQALNQFKHSLKASLLLGVISTAYTLSVQYIPLISSFALALGLLFFQDAAKNIALNIKTIYDFSIFKKKAFSYLGTALILLPSSILAGSAIGLLQSPQDRLTSLPISMGTSVLTLYFYFLFSHSLMYHIQSGKSLPKAIDVLGKLSLRKFRSYILLSTVMSVFIVLAGFSQGLCFIFALPLLFYTSFFAFKNLEMAS